MGITERGTGIFKFKEGSGVIREIIFCPGSISETTSYTNFIGGDIGWGVRVQHHNVTFDLL